MSRDPCHIIQGDYNSPILPLLLQFLRLFPPPHLPSSSLSLVLYPPWSLPVFLDSPELVRPLSASRRVVVILTASRLISSRPISGPKREIKFAVESYWAGKSSAEDLQKVAAEIRKQSWTSVKAKGVDFIPRSVRVSPPSRLIVLNRTTFTVL